MSLLMDETVVLSRTTAHEFYARINNDGRARAERVGCVLSILKAVGSNLTPTQTMVDLGCGDGGLVNEFRRQGFTAYGCDIEFPDVSMTRWLRQEEIIHAIPLSPYTLPYHDESVDVVISDQVMEHVADYPAVLKEISRILRPGGVSLHIFPSRYRLIEPHVFVPFASIIRARPWLWFWAVWGIRNEFQLGISARAAVERNSHYLRNHTFYLRKARLRAEFHRFFRVVQFREDLFLQQSGRARMLLRSLCGHPLVAMLYSAINSRVVVLRR